MSSFKQMKKCPPVPTSLAEYMSWSLFERMGDHFMPSISGPGFPSKGYGEDEWVFRGHGGAYFTVYTRYGEPRIGASTSDKLALANFKKWLKDTCV